MAAKMQDELKQLEHDVLPLLPNNKTANILDIGCGYGVLLQMLQQHDYTNVLGIDLSEEQLAIAQQMGINNTRCIDIFEFLGNSSTQYDVITGMDIIEHFSKNELLRLLQLLKSKLTPTGQLIFRTTNLDGLAHTPLTYGDYTHELFLNQSSATQLFKSVGFTQVSVLPTQLLVKGVAKKVLQKLLYAYFKTTTKLKLLATAQSSKDMVLTPLMIIHAKV